MPLFVQKEDLHILDLGGNASEAQGTAQALYFLYHLQKKKAGFGGGSELHYGGV